MHSSSVPGNPVTVIFGKAPLFYGAVKFEHTLFALPFAYLGMVLAADGWPGWGKFIWITVAMVSARTLAMSSNRLIHHKEDAANPRTANRHLPKGLLKPGEMVLLMAVSVALFFVAAAQLNGLALALAPVAAAVVILYSYAKYYTWGSHFVLGWADAIAPAAAWIGVTGRLDLEAVLLALAVAAWISGFDIMYSCSDYDFDRKYGIHSIPRKFGLATALRITKILHVLTVVTLLALGMWMGLGILYYVGWAVAVALLIYENSLVKPTDLSKLNVAFFRVNSYISLILFGFTALSVAVG